MRLHPEDIIRVYIGQEVLNPNKRTAIPTDKFNHTIEIADHQLHLSPKGARPFMSTYNATEIELARYFYVLPMPKNGIFIPESFIQYEVHHIGRLTFAEYERLKLDFAQNIDLDAIAKEGLWPYFNAFLVEACTPLMAIS